MNQVVAVLECNVPNMPRFTVHGCVPVPKGYKPKKFGPSPFTVLDQNGVELPTQCDAVSYYPDGDIAVVELSASVNKLQLPAGQKHQFQVIDKQSKFGLVPVSLDMLNLAANNNRILLRATDVFGNVYQESISFKLNSNDYRTIRFHKAGPGNITSETGGWMIPRDSSPTVLPYLGGVQGYLTSRDDFTEVIDLSIVWHNAGAPLALADIYFEKLELILPAGWDAISEWPEPEMGNGSVVGGQRVIPLVKPRGDGKMHILPQRFQRIWRLYLHKVGNETQAQQRANQPGWAVCKDLVVAGKRTWCWSNPETANYFAQRTVLPTLDHTTGQAVQFVNQEKNQQYNELQNGSKWMNLNGATGQLGYFNPAGVPYGGQTGGDEILQWDGIESVMTGEVNGLLMHRAKHRRYTDRSANAFYGANNLPVFMDNYLNNDGSAQWSMFNGAFEKKSWPFGNEDDDAPWEFDEADDFHVNHVVSNNLAAPYAGTIKSFDIIDHQHEVRRTKDLKVLIWIDNDVVAKRHLALQAELGRMAYYEGKDGRFEELLQDTLANPNKGNEFGRGQAWVTDAIVSHYATENLFLRGRFKTWLDTTHDILFNSQMPNGAWQRKFDGKIATNPPFNGKYSVSRPNECMFTNHAVKGLLRSVYEGVDATRTQRSTQMIKAVGFGQWLFFWKWKQDLSGPDGPGPWNKVAVGDLNPASQPWFNHFQHPPEQFAGGQVKLDDWHFASILGHLLDATLGTSEQQEAVDIIKVHTGGNPLVVLQNQGIQQMHARAGLLGLLQNNPM